MRPTPPAFSQSNSCGPSAAVCALAAFRSLPRAADLPAEQAVLARQEVSLAEISLPNGFVLTLSMADGRLGRKPHLHMRLFDHTGRACGGPLVAMDPRRAAELVEAGTLFLARAKPTPGLFAEVKRGWQPGAEQEGEAA
jgi:propanediol dehydratase small subunit